MQSSDGRTLIEWQTGYEMSNLGFNLYRDLGGKRTRLNTSLIGGTAMLAGARTPFTAGFSYAWMDTLASPKDLATYWLEDVDVNGKTVMHGPISPMSVYSLPPQSQSLMFSQLRSNAPGATVERVLVGDSSSRVKSGRVSSLNLQTQWEIAGKAGAKFLIAKSGWYRLTQPELVAAGFDVSKDPRFYQLFVDGADSLGESLLLSAQGGAIAVWASSAQTVAASQEAVDQEFVRQLFQGMSAKSKLLTIGEAVQRAKAVSLDEAIIRSWILLGDPMIRLR